MLSDVQIRKAKSKDHPYKLADGGGLHLHIAPTGTKSWRLKYRIAGKEKLLSFGRYPETSLAAAREHRDAAKKILRNGKDPSIEKKKLRLITVTSNGNTFESVAREWHALQERRWSDVHASDVIWSLERDVFPSVGDMPVNDLTPPLVLSVLKAIEGRGAIETAKRVRQRMSAVFVYAIAAGLGQNDPAAIVAPALATQVKRNQPAIVDLGKAREILQNAESIPAHAVTKLGLRFLALHAVRPWALRGAAWTEIEDLDGPEPMWRIPKERMKGEEGKKEEHEVPLSQHGVDVLRALQPLTGRCPLIFPSVRNAHKPMSENAIGYLLNRAGYHGRHVPHGWRSTFSTIMNERFKPDRDVIDLMLAHVPINKVEAAYNRARYLKRRRYLAQKWADMIMKGMPPAASLLQGPRR